MSVFGEMTYGIGAIPAPSAAQIWLDFDGTITRRDVLDDLIQSYALNDSWKLIEERWQTGQIGSRECLRQEFDLIRISRKEMAAFLETVAVDTGFGKLMQVLRHHDVPAAILSDGIDWFINAVLERNGVNDLPVRSNTLLHRGRRLTLRCPNSSKACTSAAAHCKCASAEKMNTERRQTIYVGDGRSDLCPSRKANVVFAKGALAAALAREQIPFHPFVTLGDVADQLTAAWATENRASA